MCFWVWGWLFSVAFGVFVCGGFILLFDFAFRFEFVVAYLVITVYALCLMMLFCGLGCVVGLLLFWLIVLLG